MSLLIKILYLIIGVCIAAGIPLGLLGLAIWYANKTEQNGKQS